MIIFTPPPPNTTRPKPLSKRQPPFFSLEAVASASTNSLSVTLFGVEKI